MNMARWAVAKGLRRELVLLPLDVGWRSPLDESWRPRWDLLPVRYTYQASPEGFVEYQAVLSGKDLQYDLYAMAFEGRQAVLGPRCLSLRLPSITANDTLRVALTEPAAWLNGNKLETGFRQGSASRKFIAELQLETGKGHWSRRCSHYLPFADKPIGQDYYFGDDYTNYPLHTRPEYALDLVGQYAKGGRLLDVGCAMGIYTKAFLEAGYDAYGVDISEFAVGEAVKRAGPSRARQANLDRSEIPYEGRFDVLWMHDVLEHSADPQALLKKATDRAAPNAHLFVSTSNADSMAHRLLGRDWDGYSDYSHYGVGKITAAGLKGWLGELGWQVLDWQCHGFWFSAVDPVMSRLKLVFQTMPELVTFLAEQQMGDEIALVARKT